MMLGFEIVGVVLLLIVGISMLVGNHMMEKAVHEDNHEAEAYLAQAAAKAQKTPA